MTPDLNDRLMATHIANASDTSVRLVRDEPKPHPLWAWIQIGLVILSWLVIFGVGYVIYLLSAIFEM